VKLGDDDFVLFGLPRRQQQDAALIDQRWRELQASAHPDRFAAEGAAAQRAAMQWAARINQARQRLRDPLARAAYLCELGGVAIDAENNTAMPAEFLHQQMHWRESLEEAAAGASVHRLDDEVAAAEKAGLDELQSLLVESADRASLDRAAARIRAMMFVRRFREDIERRLDALDAHR
jgi:molecular chaperone HscB